MLHRHKFKLAFVELGIYEVWRCKCGRERVIRRHEVTVEKTFTTMRDAAKYGGTIRWKSRTMTPCDDGVHLIGVVDIEDARSHLFAVRCALDHTTFSA